MDRYEKLKAAYDEQMRASSKERKKTLVEPEYVQIVLSDFTIEVLVRQCKINPLDELNDRQREISNKLPITFTTAEGLEIASEYNISERTFKEWLKSNFFRHISHGQYEKRYK